MLSSNDLFTAMMWETTTADSLSALLMDRLTANAQRMDLLVHFSTEYSLIPHHQNKLIYTRLHIW